MTRVKSLPIWFWLFSLAGLVWYVVALGNAYILWVIYDYSVTPFPIPNIYLAIVAFNVAGGLIGYIFMMLNKKLSIILFHICLIAGFAQVMYVNTAQLEISYFGLTPDYIQPFIIVTTAFASVAFARIGLSKGWIS